MNGKVVALVLGFIAAAAWVNFAEHPTARNLRTAVVDTLAL